MIERDLIVNWREQLQKSDAGLHLADTHHPLQIFVGADEVGAPRLVIRTTAEPVRPSLSEIVTVERFTDQTEHWNLRFTLEDRAFTEVFLRLADDIHHRSADAPNEIVALDRVGSIIDQWRRLLRPRGSGLLSPEELRGLIGELWLLHRVFSETRTTGAAIEGWLGPLGLPQDFWYADEGHCEAKSTGPASTHITISSEAQLDADDLQLAVLRIATTSEGTSGATNLPTLVNQIRSEISAEANHLDSLDTRLKQLGADPSHSSYQEAWFVVDQITFYDVAADFPAIRSSDLPTGISHVQYQLDLNAIDTHRRASIGVA